MREIPAPIRHIAEFINHTANGHADSPETSGTNYEFSRAFAGHSGAAYQSLKRVNIK